VRLGDEIPHHRERRVDNVAFFHYCVDESVGRSIARIKKLAGKNPLLGQTDADVLQHRSVPPAPGMIPSATSGKPNACMGGRDAEVACEGKLPAATERVAIESGDRGEGKILELNEDPLNQAFECDNWRPVDQLVYVGPGGEGTIAGAGDDQAASL
jgi:hypothetical protein